MKNLTTPLGLKDKIRKVPVRPDTIPLLDILIIAFFISQLSSFFLFPPGINITLPESNQQLSPGTYTAAVLTVNQTNTIFFEGDICDPKDLEKNFKEYVSSCASKTPILLAKISEHASINAFYKICEVAQSSGFAHVQLASNLKQKPLTRDVDSSSNPIKPL